MVVILQWPPHLVVQGDILVHLQHREGATAAALEVPRLISHLPETSTARLPPEATITVTPITPHVGTSTALLDTMIARDTALGVAGVLEVKVPLVGGITLRVPVVVQEVPAVEEEEVAMEVSTAIDAAMTVTSLVDLHQATIATPRVVIVMAVAAVEVGGIAQGPRPLLVATLPLRGLVVIPHPVPHKGARTAVPQGNIRTPLPAALITMVVVPALVPSLLAQNLPLMTVMDHRPVVVVVV